MIDRRRLFALAAAAAAAPVLPELPAPAALEVTKVAASACAYVHADFEAIYLNVGDSITFTITDKLL